MKTNKDPIERQAAIDALKGLPTWWADEGGYYGGAQPPMVALLDPEDAAAQSRICHPYTHSQKKIATSANTDTLAIFSVITAGCGIRAITRGRNSMDLIDRASVLKAIDEYERLSAVSQTVRNMTSLREIVQWLPSVSEIIKCKDCRHNGSFDTDCPINWSGKEYCSFAERRTDE